MGTTKDERKPIQLTEDMKEKIERFIKGFGSAPETCEDVEKYFKIFLKEDREKLGKYLETTDYLMLAKYFKDEKENHSFTDVCYKMWLKNLIDNNREEESIVLSCLKEEYEKQHKDKAEAEAKAQVKEDLRNFIFLVNEENPEYNQKWHFFISYWGYIEFVTLFYIKNEIKPLYERKILGNRFYCKELKKWYEFALNLLKTENSK